MVLELTRREFLLSNLAWGLAAVSPIALTREFTQAEERVLGAIARTIFPDEWISEEAIQRGLRSIATHCGEDTNAFGVVTSGTAVLDAACPAGFCAEGPGERVRILERIDSSQFFRLVYSHALEGIYGCADVWPAIATRAV
jgi:hypothetical protein